jgi:hypothetical protein
MSVCCPWQCNKSRERERDGKVQVVRVFLVLPSSNVHPFIHSFIHCPFSPLSIPPFCICPIHSFYLSFIHLAIHLVIHFSFIHLATHLVLHFSFIHLAIHLVIHFSFIHWPFILVIHLSFILLFIHPLSWPFM